MKAKKAPPNTPERGERCCLRGDRSKTGTLHKYDPDSQWATVDWDSDPPGPKLCHRFELLRVNGQ